VILLVDILWIIHISKNFLFLSPSCIHYIMEFWCQLTSSRKYISSNCCFSLFSSIRRDSILPWMMICFCIYSIYFSRIFWAWNIFPSVALFHFMILCLKFLSFYWNLYMSVPCNITTSSHHFWKLFWKYGWDNHNFSKPKGFLHGEPESFVHSWTD